MKKLITFILIVTLALSCVVVSACGRTTSQEYSYSKISVSRKSNQVSISKPLDLRDNVKVDLSDLEKENKVVAYKNADGQIISSLRVKSYVINKTQEGNFVYVNIVIMVEKIFSDVELDTYNVGAFTSTFYRREDLNQEWTVPDNGDPIESVIKNGIYEGGGFVKAYTFGTEVSEPDQLKYFKLVLSDYVVQK